MEGKLIQKQTFQPILDLTKRTTEYTDDEEKKKDSENVFYTRLVRGGVKGVFECVFGLGGVKLVRDVEK